MIDFFFSNRGMFTRQQFWIGIISTGVFFTILNTILDSLRLQNLLMFLISWGFQLFVLYNIYEKRLNSVGKYHKILYFNMFCCLIFVIYSLASTFGIFTGETVIILSSVLIIILSLVLLVICGFFPGNSNLSELYPFPFNGKICSVFLKDLHRVKNDFAPDFSTSGAILVKGEKYDVYFDSATYASSDKSGELYVFHLKDIHWHIQKGLIFKSFFFTKYTKKVLSILIILFNFFENMSIPNHAKKVFAGKTFDVYHYEQKMFDGSTQIFEKL